MEQYQILFSILSAIILFLFGLSAFTHELKTAAGTKLKAIMSALTVNRFTAFFVGAAFTAIIQSSTAVSSLAVSLVDGGILSFAGAIAILLGAYVGTTATAWIVSFKIAGIGPLFIVIGTLLSFLPFKIKIFGKALFYFGFIFFSLDLVSSSVAPLRESPFVLDMLLYTNTPLMGILIGTLLTVVLQSSTVVTGLAIIFVQQGLVTPADSIPIILGANIGTTATALFASMKMSKNAQKVAVANTLINTFGVLLFLPFLQSFTDWVLRTASGPSFVVAIAHLAFNVVLVSIFLVALTPFTKLMDMMFGPERQTT